MGVLNSERLACYALAVQVYFSGAALSYVSLPFPSSSFRRYASMVSRSQLFVQSNSNPDDPGPPPFPQTQFDSTSLPPPEELPDDVPKDVSQEKLEKAINRKGKTLYEILEASPTATRAELKKKYVEMAKLSHPDAQIGRTDYSLDDAPDFGEVAAAWRILGDVKSRKRYDRELQYKEWSAYASKYANEKLEEAVPAVAKIMDDVAVPFIRRTAATTVAVSEAVSRFRRAATGRVSNSTNGEESGTRSSLTDAFMNAIKAGRKAGRAIDSMELNEKSERLSER